MSMIYSLKKLYKFITMKYFNFKIKIDKNKIDITEFI